MFKTKDRYIKKDLCALLSGLISIASIVVFMYLINFFN
jgi:hypothetical protein